MNPNKKTISIGGVETFSAVDFPGKMAAAVFMQGCPWRCPFCYNTHLQPIDSQTDFVWEKFVEFLQKRKGVLDAVVFSGGEPLVQEALKDAIKEVKDMGYIVGLHTGGYRPTLLEKILPELSWIGFDIKAPFEEDRYKEAVGFPVIPTDTTISPHVIARKSRRSVAKTDDAAIAYNNSTLQSVLKSLDMIIKQGIAFECRTTCDPRILSIEDIYNIAKSLKEKGVKNYHLQKYRPIPSDKTTQENDCEKFFEDKELANFLKNTFEKSELRK